MAQDDYKVELEVFEGPLDLLLYLIKMDEVDIYNIPIERIATQYMEYLNLMRMLDLSIAGEFIVMAATLMLIKSRMLLPVEERIEGQEDQDEGVDPRWELVRQLVEYKKFKDAAARLFERGLQQENIFGMGGDTLLPDALESGIHLQDVSLFDLITAFQEVLKNAKPEAFGEVVGHAFTVGEKIEAILGELRRQATTTFSSLFRRMATRPEIICTFLALLELARLRQIAIRQTERFGEIFLSLSEPPAASEPAIPEEPEEPAVEPPAAGDSRSLSSSLSSSSSSSASASASEDEYEGEDDEDEDEYEEEDEDEDEDEEEEEDEAAETRG